MATRKTGNAGYAEVDATIVHITSWNADHKVETEDSTTTESGGAQDVESVLEMLDGQFAGIWDADAVPTASSPGLTAGKVIDALKLYVGPPSDGKFIQCKALIKQVTIESAVKGLVKYNCQFTSKGAITMPS